MEAPTTNTAARYSLQLCRKLFALCDSGEFRAILEKGLTPEELSDLIFSLNAENLTPDEFIDGEYIENGNRYFSSNDYVTTREGSVVHEDDANYCEYFDEYTTDDLYRCYINRRSYCYSETAAQDLCLYYYEGDYYDYEGLDYNNLVIDYRGNIACRDDVYYWESDGEYHYEPEEEERFTRSYHSGRTKMQTFTDNPRFYIGFEIEKEDCNIKESVDIDTFEEKCPKWRKEDDGSLDSEKGYELISPCYELIPERIEQDIKGNDILLNHINANFSKERCGGHINISENGLTGEELFNKLEGYTPLFHALYYGRVDKNYSKGKSNKSLKDDGSKYQSIRIHDNRLEYRIVSAVPDFNTLMWRCRLFEIILNSPTGCPKQAFFNVQTILKDHLQKVYINGRYEKLISRIIDYTLSYEGINVQETETTN